MAFSVMDTLFLQKPSVVARFEPEEFGFASEDFRLEAFCSILRSRELACRSRFPEREVLFA
jgi:hypothetical protein